MFTEAENNEETRMDIMFDRLMLMELRENVAKVDMKAFAELRSYIDPPRIVHDILKAVTAIFNSEETEQGLLDDWQQMKGVRVQSTLDILNSDISNSAKLGSVYLNKKYILIAFSNHNLALETFSQVQITRSAN